MRVEISMTYGVDDRVGISNVSRDEGKVPRMLNQSCPRTTSAPFFRVFFTKS